MSKTVNAGIVTAYGAAVRGGYEGTYAQFCADLAQLSQVLEEFLGFSVTVETLAAGASATASYDDGVLALGIPRGNTGNGIQSIVLNADYTLTVTYTNGNTWTSGSIRGQVGATPHLTIGTVQTLEPGQSATADITGTDEDPILNLGIPKGQAGASDAGGVSYDPESSYNDGTVGAELQEQNRHLNDETTGLDTKAPVILETASGAIASFDDGADGMPIRKIVATIVPVQDLHGYDNPWPAGGGKNLYNPDLKTATGNNTYYTTDVLPNTQYAFSVDIMQSGLYAQYDNDGAWTNIAAIYDNTALTFNSGEHTRIRLMTYNADNVQQAAKFQLELGSSATSFAPYENICPISGHTGAEIEQAGKNLANTTVWYAGIPYNPQIGTILTPSVAADVTDYEDGTFGWPIASWRSRSLRAEIKPGERYYLSGTLISKNDGAVGWVITDKDYKVLAVTASFDSTTFYSRNITAPNDAKWIWLYFGDRSTGSATENIVSKPMVELDSTASAYEPYTGNQISVTFPTTIYGGEDEVISGKLKSAMGMVDLGTLNWTYYANAQIFRNTVINSPSHNIICSTYKTQHPYSDWEHLDDKAIQAGATEVIVKDSSYTDATAFKAAMSGVQLCYELAEPVEYTTEPQTLDTLYGTNNIWSSTGDTEVTYPADTKLYIDNKITQAIANALNS